MKFPGWKVIIEKMSVFQKKAREHIEDFKQKNPIASSIIESLFELLPPPFNAIAAKIYNDAEGTAEDKIDSVIEYLNEIQARGEEHYNQITSKLDSTLAGLVDIRTITAKESTLLDVKEILISNSDRANEIMTDLTTKLGNMDYKLDTVMYKVDTLLEITRTTNGFSEIVEKRNNRIQQGASFQPPKIVLPSYEGNIITLKRGEDVILTIKYENLMQWSDADRLALNTYHRNLLDYQRILLNIESKLPQAALNPVTEEILRVQREDYIGKMCKELIRVNNLLKPIEVNLNDYYRDISEICKHVSEL
jgi:hypothetical protein